MLRWLGKILCWMGLHDWYPGIHTVYCIRHGCEENLGKLYHMGQDEGVDCDDT